MISTALAAFGFLRGNWQWVLLAGAALWGGWQYVGRIEAEGALAAQKLQILIDDNAAWLERENKRQAFEKEVRAGFERLQGEVAAVRATNEKFKQAVNANAGSKVPLDPDELAALRLLGRTAGDDKAGGDPVRPAGQPPRLR